MPYNEAFKGLKGACNCDLKQFLLSEMQRYDVVKELQRERPQVIVAIGSGAVEKIKAIKNIPIVYLMVPDTQSDITGKSNMTGVNMDIPPDMQLDIVRQALPEVGDIGLLYNPVQQGGFIEKAKAAAASAGIGLTANAVGNPRKVSDQLNLMTGKIKAFWMLPDVSVITPETVEILFLYTLKNKLPVITFSSKFLEMGALMSFEVDPNDMGVQAAEIISRILSGADVNQIPDTNARKINITINDRTAKKLGLTISNEILNKARVINRD
ncbi:MAG: ABC transporter substrate-binding protein [Nitrospirae bacterium]|nr:ABC transporter substrate-binding protein [Nitrospirota bacterium]